MLSYNKRLNLLSSCDVISDIINMIFTFQGWFAKDLFTSDVKLRLYWKFRFFLELTQFWEIQLAILIAKSIPYIWFWTDALAQILIELWHLKCDLLFHHVT